MYRKIRARIKEFEREIGKLILDKRKKERDIKLENIKKNLLVRYDGKIKNYIVSYFV